MVISGSQPNSPSVATIAGVPLTCRIARATVYWNDLTILVLSFVLLNHTALPCESEGIIRLFQRLSPNVTLFILSCDERILHIYPFKRLSLPFKCCFMCGESCNDWANIIPKYLYIVHSSSVNVPQKPFPCHINFFTYYHNF